MSEKSSGSRRIVHWLTNATTVVVVAQWFAVDGYLRLLLLFTGAFVIVPAIAFLAGRGVARRVRRWEGVWLRSGSSLAPIVVMLFISSISVLFLTTFVWFWEVQRGNGPVVSASALLVSSLGVAANARFGVRLRWMPLGCAAMLLGSAAWIEIDRWWVIAVLAGYKSGVGAFVANIDWAWPPHAITILLCVAGVLVFLQWIVDRRSLQTSARRTLGDPLIDIKIDRVPRVPDVAGGDSP